jgi:hypothetical protein
MFNTPDVEQWWAHNCGNFDGLLLHSRARGLGIRTEAILAGGNRVICFTFTRGDREIRLYDSFALAPSSLRELAKDFHLDGGKVFNETDYKGDMRDLPYQRLRDGCIRDAKLVGQLLKILSGLIENWGGKRKATFSSSALSVVRHNLRENGRKLPKIDIGINQELRPACFGGRVEVIHHDPGSTIDYDRNSSYSASMSEQLPFEYLHCDEKGKERDHADSDYCLYRVRVKVANRVFLPVIPFRPTPESGIFFPIGEFEGIYTEDELNYAVEIGAAEILKIEKTWTFKKEAIFSQFITDVYALKQTALGAVRTFTKYILNGCYGKFSEKPEHCKLATFPTYAEAVAWGMRHPGKLTELDKEGTVSLEEFKYSPHTHFALAAAILAKSRVALHRELSSAHEPNYCDTDSVRCFDHPTLVESGGLGGWKQVIKAARALNYAPKVYRLCAEDGTTLKDEKGKLMIACKGFPCSEKSFAEMVALKKVATHRLEKLKTQAKKHPLELQGINIDKTWSGLSMKRRPFKDGSTEPWSARDILENKHLKARCPLL